MSDTFQQTASTTTPMFTASEVENRTGVPATTLRQWERRYGLPNPQRTASGYRLYSLEDIGCIEFLKQNIAAGVPASRAAQLYVLQKDTPLTDPAPSNPKGAGSDMVARLAEAALQGDAIKADRVLASAHASLPVEDVVTRVIEPALVMIGDKWHRGEVTVAHEHQATAYLRGKLHGLLELAGSARHGPVVVVACAPLEWHELGALTMAIFLRRAGLRTHYLGANTPIHDLARFAKEVRADAVLISATASEAVSALRAAKDRLNELGKLVVYGGQAFNERPELARELGGEFLGGDAASALDSLLARFERPS